jgi:hypothetical protein
MQQMLSLRVKIQSDAYPLIRHISPIISRLRYVQQPKTSSPEHPVLREFPLQPRGGSSGQPVGISKPTTIAALLSAAAWRRPTSP